MSWYDRDRDEYVPYYQREREREAERERERREYEADVFYDVWRSGRDPDAIDYSRVDDAFCRGARAEDAASAEIGRQDGARRRAREEREAEEAAEWERYRQAREEMEAAEDAPEPQEPDHG